MDRSYVKDYIDSAVKKNGSYLSAKDKEDLIDSILFDWNEIDSEGDFEDLVNWNVDQFLSHNTAGGEKITRIDFVDRDKFIPYNRDWFDISYKPRPKYFMFRPKEDGYDEVYYFLDRKENDKNYSNKLLE